MKGSIIVAVVFVIALLAALVAFDYGHVTADYLLTTTKRDVRTHKDSPGQVAVVLDNRSSRAMKILGVKSDCGCVDFDEALFPLPVPPRSIRMFLLTVSSKTGTSGAHIDCFIDTGTGVKKEEFDVSGHW